MQIMKKVLALLLSVIILCSVLTGCGGSNNTSGTSETTSSESSNEETASDSTEKETKTEATEAVKCVYYVPGDAPTDLAAVLGMVNEKMAADGVGVKLEVKYIPWDAWDQKINIMLSTGEEFDMFHVMNDRVSLSTYASRGALADITEYMDKYGDNIKKLNPEIMMKAGQVGGKQYAIPAYWVEFSINPQITIRKDLMREYGITKMPTTFEELTAAFEKVMKEWKGAQKPYVPLIGSQMAGLNLTAKTYDTWPYTIYDKFIYVNQDGTIMNYFETEEFRQDCYNARIWYEKGLINPDVLVFTNDQLNAQLNSGDWFIHLGTYGNSIENIKKNYPDITADDFGFIDLAPEKPNVRPYGTRNMQAVPLSSKHPEAGVKFVNWLYASQENYDLFMYGREGIDYKKVEPRNREDIVDPAKGVPLYKFDDWMIGNVEYLRPAIGSPTITNELLYNKDETAVDGIAAQFTFDAREVQTQMADVQTQISAVIAPIACGVKDYDSNIDEALSLLKKAGIDDIIEAYKKQFEASK